MATPGRILYVEDDPVMAEMYRFGLERAGYAVTVAPDAAAGLTLLGSRRFDLVLLDVMLPGKDGITMLAEIRANPALGSMPVAILSNSERGREVDEKARRLGILAWMTKVWAPPSTVVRAVNRWLDPMGLTRSAQKA